MIKPQQLIKIGLTAVTLSVILGESVVATSPSFIRRLG
ncbi:hypothetical protein N39L_19250 [Limnospira platensis NIES-39]|uniref:Uncharacterized protein n=1 Tax=Limnospira platensis NIES-46 TaxID=1236695 RepID=A0A5M3TA54_LIMPL|nr:hypothetical protein N39L_19250 [Arthrospira platensis NIES-39]GCE96364.1 hypothetical protein NIES46_44340 [Arthrospira platensis NIES-46]